MPRWCRGLIGVLGFLALCEVIGRAGLVRREYLPPPSDVAVQLVQLLGQNGFVADTVATVLTALVALGLASVIAVPLGLLLGSVPVIRRMSINLVELLRPIPSVALIPFVVILLGVDPESKIALATYASLWPILFNTMYAMGDIDPLLTEVARSYGCSRTRILASVALPAAAPFVLTGMRIASSISLIVVISTELLVPATGGLGHIVYLASSNGQMDLVLAGTVVAGVLGYLIDTAFRRAQHRWLGWSEQGQVAG